MAEPKKNTRTATVEDTDMAPAPPAMPSHQTSSAPSAPSAPQGQPGNPPLRLNITKQQAQALYAKYKTMKEQGLPNTDPQMMHAKSVLSHLKRYQEWRRKQHTKAPPESNASGEPGAKPNPASHTAPQTREEPARTAGGGASSSPTEPGTGPTALHPPPQTPQQAAQAHRQLAARHLAHAWKSLLLADDSPQSEEVAALAGKLNMMGDFHAEASKLTNGDEGLRARVREAKIPGGSEEGIGENIHVAGGGGGARLPTASGVAEQSSDGEDVEVPRAKRQRRG
ncbi:hypothetical protein KC343_g9066 [Hortaea werneckii]|nr:hypothetical protein KC352_g21284 [Hortaea werneckii]KAI7566143.1 hypothetical protein KC317_g5865 [Hortaea werneckii]KAI7617405.1 hypothetical protein KC346_g5498 [Hortaea werneckii]KAI7618530.1 hypothetical protein KC343_g9066 [Hortaea werneckii]KAI7671655.1 hypothetical protein KC319_g5501 [Hortaea werneckii]